MLSRLLVCCIALGAAVGTAIADLSGPYEPQNWVRSGIQEGTTSITPESGVSESITFGYDVDLGNPGNGVPFRTATYSVVADKSGILCFDWEYTGFHAFNATRAYLEIFAVTSDGGNSIVLVDGAASGGFTFSGVAEIEVEAGMEIRIIAGGSNYDYNSRLRGDVTLTNFSRPLALDGAYTMGNWSSTGISEGITAITPETGDAVVASFSYDVDLGNPGGGVTFRTTTFSAPAGADGTVTFDYDYNGFHSLLDTRVYLEVFAETASGTNRIVLIDEPNSDGFNYSGSVSIDVEKGMDFGIIVGGGNSDDNSVILGQVDLRKFAGPVAFDGVYRLEHWSNTGISEGTTATDPVSGPTDRAEFSYNVDLGNPGGGVTFRTTEWSVVSDHAGLVSINWDYSGFHSYFDTEVYLEIFAETTSGTNRVVLVNEPNSGGFDYSGTVVILAEAGMPFGFIAGGGNYDTISRIQGTVGLEGLAFSFCPADFNEDGTVNTLDVLVFLNAWNAKDPSADFNEDGEVNTLDVLAFLNAWSSGC